MKFRLLTGLLALGIVSTATHAEAVANYPSKPITIIMPFAAGSPTDVVARVMTASLARELGQSLVIQNKPGATGMIGSEYVARSAPDGYTLLFGTNTTQVANKYFFKDISYDGIKDFEPIAIVGGVPHALVVNESIPVNSVQEFIDYVKANPGKVAFPFANSTTRITGHTFRVMTGTDVREIPYKAYGQAVAELIGGQTQMMFLDFSTGLQHMKSGKVKALAITPERSEKLPGVPAMREALPGFEIGNWNGLFAPAGTPKPIIDKIHNAVATVLQEQEVRQRIDGAGYDLVKQMSPEAFGDYIEKESDHYGKLIQAAGIKAE